MSDTDDKQTTAEPAAPVPQNAPTEVKGTTAPEQLGEVFKGAATIYVMGPNTAQPVVPGVTSPDGGQPSAGSTDTSTAGSTGGAGSDAGQAQASGGQPQGGETTGTE